MLVVVVTVAIWARRRKLKASLEMKIVGSVTGIKVDKEIGGIQNRYGFFNKQLVSLEKFILEFGMKQLPLL